LFIPEIYVVLRQNKENHMVQYFTYHLLERDKNIKTTSKSQLKLCERESQKCENENEEINKKCNIT